jgi:uncharacterized membrane protein YgcG
MNGLIITTVVSGTPTVQTVNLTMTNPFVFAVDDGNIVRFQVPTGMTQGTSTVGQGTMNLGTASAPVPLTFDIRPLGGGTSSGGGGGSGGSCGAGATGLIILCFASGMRRRRAFISR